ncbi:MAG TPA: haloacid dehalogenase-like hydrolase [Candidatus Flavonifractor avicola]|nr:haloacid dehalogenase-like hydrolase [Candidatus Flavonifractor avicola]
MKKRSTSFLSVFLILAFVLGIPVALAANMPHSIEKSTTNIVIDGRQASVDGYNVDNGNNYVNLRDIAQSLDVSVAWDASTDTATLDTSAHYKSDPTSLITGNWAPETRARLETLIQENANQNRYACFDFDNTSSIYDIGNALFAYQILNLRFAMEPDVFADVLDTGLPDLTCEVGKNLDGEPVTCAQLIEDLSADYAFIYSQYEGFDGDRTLTDIRATREYQDFAAKLRWMYDAVGNTFDVSVAYPWSIYMLSGMTPDQVYDLAVESNAYWSSYGRYGEDVWTSPTDMETSAGAVSVTLDTGISFPDELVDLYQTLQANGIDVYIISASPYDLIRAASDEYGYGVPADHIFAMRLKQDDQGRYINEYDYDWGGTGKYAQSYGPGKSQIITNYIAPNYGGQGPLLVCGDSTGDVNMMNDWMECGDTQLGLIFNRYAKPASDYTLWSNSAEAVESMGDMDSRFVLQGRDENTGELRPFESTILQGTQESVLLRPEN